MEHFAAVQSKPKPPFSGEMWPYTLHDDSRWELAQRIIAGPHFARSPLLSKFLLFVVAETLEGRGDEITEHQIGVQVFDRPADYRTIEDNIVRSYARQLRKRLAEHFADQGSAEPVRIDIPVGGYVPIFISADNGNGREEAAEPRLQLHSRTPLHRNARARGRRLKRRPHRERDSGCWRACSWGLQRGADCCHLVCRNPRIHTASGGRSRHTRCGRRSSAGRRTATLCPLMQASTCSKIISRRPVPLAEYIAGSYQELPLTGVDAHSAEDLRTQQLTPFVDLQIAAALSHLSEDNPQRVFIRFPRDLRLDDLKGANAVIIGSVGSNPWAAMAETKANFRIADRPGMSGAEIINLKPRSGEAASYASHWNEPAHETFALIDFLPSLSGNGHLLVLEGLDVAGTQAAAEMLLHSSEIGPILKSATRPDGSLRDFEVLLRSTSIESNATATEVIATRIY